MDLGEMKRMAESSGALREVSESAEAQKLLQALDGESIGSALKRGDTAALTAAFAKLISTPEGKDLADRVRKAVGRK